jgi:hypothetical protein
MKLYVRELSLTFRDPPFNLNILILTRLSFIREGSAKIALKEKKMKAKMSVDLYTKIVLTIIAICLVWICLGDTKWVSSLQASTPQLVDVRIKSIDQEGNLPWDSISIKADDAIPAKIENSDSIPVNITNEMVPVDVKRVVVTQSLTPIEKK